MATNLATNEQRARLFRWLTAHDIVEPDCVRDCVSEAFGDLLSANMLKVQFEYDLPTVDQVVDAVAQLFPVDENENLDEILEYFLQVAAVFYRDWCQKYKPQ